MLYPPRCRDGTERQLYISVHESVDLACEMEANPTNLSFSWNLHLEDGDAVNQAQNTHN